MSRREGEGTKLSEAIELASRRQMPIWPSSRPFAGNVANPGLEHSNETENGAKSHGRSTGRVANIPSINARMSSFLLDRPRDHISRQREERKI